MQYVGSSAKSASQDLACRGSRCGLRDLGGGRLRGSRNWSVNFASKVTCQNYSATQTGTHRVFAHIHNNGSQWNTFDIQLVRVRNNWPDVFYNRYTKNCNVNTNSYWYSMPTGTFHWDMYKPSGGPNYTGSGTNYWPG